VASHRDRARQAESLARGGVRLGEKLLLEDMRLQGGHPQPDSLHSVWARVRGVDLDPDPDTELFLEIEDAAARINLNGVLVQGEVDAEGRAFLEQLLGGVIGIMPGKPEEQRYDAAELAANLADWLDADEVSTRGAPEEEIYARRDPPVRVANLPLLSVDELRLVEGFDGPLVDALRPFVGVYPLVGGGGVNVNTAPPWVLIQLLRGSDVSGLRPLEEEDVKRIVEAREEGPLCAGETTAAACRPLAELLGGEQLAPPPSERSNVFVVRAIARVVDVERTVVAVVDRSEPTELARLSWAVQ
jgi:type II secretory pathway component PulK